MVSESDRQAREAEVERARSHLQDVMREHSDDPRSQQLLSQALREAEQALREATAQLERLSGD